MRGARGSNAPGPAPHDHSPTPPHSNSNSNSKKEKGVRGFGVASLPENRPWPATRTGTVQVIAGRL